MTLILMGQTIPFHRFLSSKRQSPTVDEERERSTTAQPLHTQPGRIGYSESEDGSQDAAKQETEEMSQNVNALTSSPKHCEQRKRCGNGKPGSTPGCCPTPPPDHAEAAEHADRTKYRSRDTHRNVRRAVQESVGKISASTRQHH
jgi:hypothetical protein